MKMISTISTRTLLLVLALSCYPNLYGQVSQDKSTDEAVKRTYTTPGGTITLRPRMNVIRTVDFHLRDGTLVYGKLVSEDKNKVTVEKMDESKIIVTTYSKREIEPRTFETQSVPEYKYYLDLAEHFAARTWDFRDDPDDFIQAIRSCEKAKQLLLESQTQDSERVEQIDKRIENLQADRQVWEREVKSRAELKRLEFEAEIENRIKQLEDRIDARGQQIDKSLTQLDEFTTQMKDNYQKLEQTMAGISQDISRRLNILADQVESNRRLIDPWRGNLYPRSYYYYRPYYRPGDQR